MARAWLITSRGIAKKVKNNTCLSSYQIREVGAEANRECPNCKYLIDNSDVTVDWPGLPAGVKFDPSDIELLEHLAAKIGLENSKPHTLIDEFIPMLDVEEGICYTHPQNLPGAQKNGSSIHFFHRISNAYGIGQRKRRKISQSSLLEENVRWHKTGKTKPVLESGVQKGWKKIMVLYRSTKRGSKPDKANWVMHQYHIGPEEDEMEGQLVVSKIFYQQLTTQFDKSEMDCTNEEIERLAARVGPRTPKPDAPQPPRMKEDSPNEACGLYLPHLLDKENCYPISEVPPTPIPLNQLKSTKGEDLAWRAGESQAVVEPEPGSNFNESLLCQEVLDSFPDIDFSNINSNRNEIINDEISNTASRFPDLDDIIVDTPPDFELSDLEFGSQESSMSWLDHI